MPRGTRAFALAVSLIFAAPCSAENWPRFRGADGSGVSGVTVILENGNGQVVASSVTGPDGVFRFDNLPIQSGARWFIRLTGAANSQGLAIDLAPNKLYTVQFTGTTP